MTFYLLKSKLSDKSNNPGDVVFDLNKLESLVFMKKKNYYAVAVTLLSGENYNARYDSLDDLKATVKDMVGEDIDFSNLEIRDIETLSSKADKLKEFLSTL